MTIQEQDDGQWRVEVVHACMMVKLELLYADKKMVASTDPVWIQLVFDKLTGIF